MATYQRDLDGAKGANGKRYFQNQRQSNVFSIRARNMGSCQGFNAGLIDLPASMRIVVSVLSLLHKIRHFFRVQWNKRLLLPLAAIQRSKMLFRKVMCDD